MLGNFLKAVGSNKELVKVDYPRESVKLFKSSFYPVSIDKLNDVIIESTNIAEKINNIVSIDNKMLFYPCDTFNSELYENKQISLELVEIDSPKESVKIFPDKFPDKFILKLHIDNKELPLNFLEKSIIHIEDFLPYTSFKLSSYISTSNKLIVNYSQNKEEALNLTNIDFILGYEIKILSGQYKGQIGKINNLIEGTNIAIVAIGDKMIFHPFDTLNSELYKPSLCSLDFITINIIIGKDEITSKFPEINELKTNDRVKIKNFTYIENNESTNLNNFEGTIDSIFSEINNNKEKVLLYHVNIKGKLIKIEPMYLEKIETPVLPDERFFKQEYDDINGVVLKDSIPRVNMILENKK
jgi:hypothetical protein